MKIGFYSTQDKYKVWGVGVYAKNLLAALHKIPNTSIQEFSNISEISDADVVHYPYFEFFRKSMPYRIKFPIVVTLHDITPLLFPKHYPPGVYGTVMAFLQKIVLRRVDAVITDSDSSKHDIEHLLGVAPEKIFRVYLASDPGFMVIHDNARLRETVRKYKLQDKFLIYVGNINWNKNIYSIAQASVALGLDLYLIGKNFNQRDNLDHAELASFKAFLQKFGNNPLIHMPGFIPQEDLVSIMNLGTCLMMPSYYEGFALPILEAQACNLPVVTSNVSSMPEVAGKGAILVDPEDLKQIISAVRSLQNPNFKRKLVHDGAENVKRFSWKKCAEETLAVYSTLAFGRQ